MPEDVLRLGIVCTAGFRYSEQFIWERPFHEKYPEDTIVFFRHEVARFIKDPEAIVLVATDRYDPEESAKTEAVIPPDNGWSPPAAGAEVVIGMTVWKLQPGSPRKGRFQPDSSKPALECPRQFPPSTLILLYSSLPRTTRVSAS